MTEEKLLTMRVSFKQDYSIVFKSKEGRTVRRIHVDDCHRGFPLGDVIPAVQATCGLAPTSFENDEEFYERVNYDEGEGVLVVTLTESYEFLMRPKPMFMTLKRDWEALDGTDGSLKKTIIPSGRYEIERIHRPNVPEGETFWLVLKGTKIGASEGSWRQWRNGVSLVTKKDHPNYGQFIEWGDAEVVIEEEA
jgi:hypothetical protein